MKYPLLHPASYLVAGALSIPAAFMLFYYYLSLEIFIFFLGGMLAGISVNEAWFRHVDSNLSLYRKALRTGRGYGKIFRGSSRIALSYFITYIFSISVFFLDFTGFIAVISGLSLTALIYYGHAKKFYRRL